MSLTLCRGVADDGVRDAVYGQRVLANAVHTAAALLFSRIVRAFLSSAAPFACSICSKNRAQNL